MKVVVLKICLFSRRIEQKYMKIDNKFVARNKKKFPATI